LARRDVALSALIRAYRIGHARFLEAAMRHLVALGPERSLPATIDQVEPRCNAGAGSRRATCG
jgi:hypothetical protein